MGEAPISKDSTLLVLEDLRVHEAMLNKIPKRKYLETDKKHVHRTVSACWEAS